MLVCGMTPEQRSQAPALPRPAAAAIAGLAVLACAAAGGANGPQRPRAAVWYLGLKKPGFTPPGPVVGATWGVLEGLLVAAGYRLLRAPASTSRDVAVAGWAGVLAGLAGFPWVFFRERRLGASALAAGAMLAAGATATVAARRVDRPAARLMLPVVGWLAFATLLAVELRRRNRSGWLPR